MIENEEYCMDIITQSLAIQKSISSLNKLIIENHLKTHISENMASKNPKSRAAALTELLDLYELDKVRGSR